MDTCDLCNNKSDHLTSHKVFSAHETGSRNSDLAYELKETRIYTICGDCAKAPLFYRFFFKTLPFFLAGLYVIIILFLLFPPLLYSLAPLTQPLIGIIILFPWWGSISIGVYLFIYLLLPPRREIFDIGRKLVYHYKSKYQRNGHGGILTGAKGQLQEVSVFTEREWKQLQNSNRVIETL